VTRLPPHGPARYPYLEHAGPLAFAHRGGSKEGPENTRAAFSHALSLGYRWLETDVHASADGVVVVVHDPSLDRVGDRRGVVTELPWAEIRRARVARARRLAGPLLCTASGPGSVGALRLASYLPGAFVLGRAPAAVAPWRRAGAAQVPLRYGGLPVADRRFIAAAHRSGLAVHVWTVDEAAEMERLLDLGVDGIMTDRPTVLRSVLERRGQWAPG
jgi:glycerophosphoryl diester phosphodiesterase